MMDDGRFGEAIHALLKELGWTHGELTSSLVLQALAQVRHLRKQAEKLAAVTAARDADIEKAMRDGFELAVDNAEVSEHDGWHRTDPRNDWDYARKELDKRIATLRKAGQL